MRLKRSPARADATAMKLLPPGRRDLISFARSHIEAWQADPAAVGLSPAAVADLHAQVEAAAAAFARAGMARDAARSATLDSNTALATLRGSTAAALATIKAFAAMQAHAGGPGTAAGVYAKANLDVPLRPAPLPAPGMVRNFSIAVSSQGEPTLTWDPPHPGDARERAASSSGLVYAIARQTPSAGAPGEPGMSLAEATADTRFTDAPLAAGTTFYKVRAMRGKQAGPWTVTLAVESGMGGRNVAAARKMAA